MKFLKIFSLSWTIILVAVLCSPMGACKKGVEIAPSITSLNGSNVYLSDASSQSVVSGLFSKMSSSNLIYNGQNSISLNLGLTADELINLGTLPAQFGLFYTNTYSPTISASYLFWKELFAELYVANTAIEGITASTKLTPAVKKQLLGELKFSRAFIMFYLTNLYGDTPLVTSSDFATNNTISRSPQALTYTQIVNDLKDAQTLLADNSYVDGKGLTSADRIRPNKQTATALLARVYLYTQDWKNAETESSAVISSSTYSLETDLNKVFLKASKEALWEIQPTTPNVNNGDAQYLIITGAPGTINQTQLPLTSFLKNAFENDDKRFANWVGQFNAPATPTAPATTYYFANKYKVGTSTSVITEYPIFFRLAEQYLIRAEARAQLGKTVDAAADLDVIRNRAGLPNTTASTQSSLINAVAHERQVELFTEFGHRWFDLKRTGKIDAVMTAVAPSKGATWSSYKQILPIPASDILADPNLTQAPGYN
jgi:hypothetical protein